MTAPTKGLADDYEIDTTPTAYDRYIAPLSKPEEWFRHSGWKATRDKVHAALCSSGAGRDRIERFEKCGSDCIIQRHSETGEIRLLANYCGDRFCTPCCTARGHRIERELLKLATGRQLKFATFTRRDDGLPLLEALDHLRASWRRLRQQAFWNKNVNAAAYAIEITRGKSGTGWHVHIHALLDARFLDQRVWSENWKLATGGSPVMHIRAVIDTKRDVAYVCKYATKALHPSVLKDKESTVEAMIALRGRRLVGTLGAWHDLDISGIIGPKEGWVAIGRFDEMFYDARRGSIASIAIFAQARRVDVAAALLMLDVKSDSG